MQKEQLLLWASLAGIFFLFLSRTLCVLISDTLLGAQLLELKALIAPFPYMGTATGTLLISAILVVSLNCLIPEAEAGLWLYHSGKFNQLEILLLSSAIGVPPAGQMSYPQLFREQLKLDFFRTWHRWSGFLRRKRMPGGFSAFPASYPRLVMVTLSDNKVYVGFVDQLPPAVASKFEYLRILPVWSGYRDGADRRVYRTTSYEKAVLADNDKDLLIKVVPAKDISMVGIHVDGTFPIEDLKPIELTARSLTSSQIRAQAQR